ncbi:MAG: hypothetical protein R3F23_05065 [Verrucomicrobiia bacterium]
MKWVRARVMTSDVGKPFSGNVSDQDPKQWSEKEKNRKIAT